MFEVGLTAPQIELDDGTIIMFWYPDLEIKAKNKSEARKIANKMINNEEIGYDVLDEDGNPISDMGKKYEDIALNISPLDPEIDYVNDVTWKLVDF